MAKKLTRIRGGFSPSRIVNKAQRVVAQIEQMPGGQQLVSAAKNNVRKKMSSALAMVAAAAAGNKTASSALAKVSSSRKKIFQDVLMGQGTTMSYAQLGAYRPSSSRVRSKVLSERKTNGRSVITSGYGLQGNVNISEAFTATAALSMLNQVPGFTSAHNTYFEPISSVVKHYFTNQDVGNVILYIYDYVARRDNSVNPSTAANDINNTGAGQNWQMDSPGQTLFDAVMFTNLYKIWKVTKVELRPGQSHIHQSNVYHTRKLNGKDFLGDQDTVTNEYIRGVTVGTFILTQSLPVLDNNATLDVLSDDSVTFGSARVLHIQTKTEALYAYPNQTTKQQYTNSLPLTVVHQRTRQDDGTATTDSN